MIEDARAEETYRVRVEPLRGEVVDLEIVLMAQLQVFPNLRNWIVPTQTSFLRKTHVDEVARDIAEVQIEPVLLKASLVFLCLERGEKIAFPPHVLAHEHPGMIRAEVRALLRLFTIQHRAPCGLAREAVVQLLIASRVVVELSSFCHRSKFQLAQGCMIVTHK